MSKTKRANSKTDKRQLAVAETPAVLERRILILAPTGNDARLTADFLTKSGLASQICRDVAGLCAEIRQGCGAILLAEETLGAASISLLVETLAQQPKWSDIPVTIITSGGEASQTQLRRLAIFGPGGNVTLLERPFRPGTLVSTVKAALRGRQRQYEMRDLVQAMQESHERYSQLVHGLPTAVYTTDAQGQVILYNEAATILWGRKPEIGKELWCGSYRIFRSDGTPLPHDQSPMAVTLREGRPVRGEEIIIERPDGTRRSVRPYPDPIWDASGKIVGAVNMLLDVTESKRAEDASRRLVAIVESSEDAIISKDLNGIITSWNRGAEKLFGYSAREAIGRSVTMLMPAERLDEEPNILKRIRRGEPIEHYQTVRRRKDGGEIEISLTVSPIRDAGGKIIGASKIVRDITKQKQADALLRQNEGLFSTLVEQAPTGMYVVDSQFRLQQVNARALPAFAQVEARMGRDFAEVMHILWGPEVGDKLIKIFRHTLATGEPYISPRFSELRHDLGEDKAYEWETQRITLPDGKHGVVCYFNDVTEAERNNANLAFLATINDDLLRLNTVDDMLNTVCAKICKYLRLSIDCFVEINEAADTSSVTHEWRQPEVPSLLGTYKLSDYLSADFQKILRAGECFVVRDTAADSRSDTEKYAELSIRSFVCVPVIADGRWKFMFNIHDSTPRDWREDEIGLVRELTARIWARLERVRAEALLRQNEALFAALIEEAPMGVYVINAQFRLQQINTRALPAFEKVEPKMGRTLTEVMHIQWGQEAGDELAAIFRRTLDTGEPYVSPGYSNIRADIGQEKTYEWETKRVTLPDGQHGVVCYFSDITERIRSEQALIQAKTIAEAASHAKDDFLAALSHELRTPLNPVLLLASEAAEDTRFPAEVRAQFATIRTNVELEARLIDDLLDITRITHGKLLLNLGLVDVNAVLEEALAKVQSDLTNKRIELVKKFAAKKPTIKGDAVRVQQVFWNVLKNAVKFTPEGGRITVSIRIQSAGELIVTVTDTGIGMTDRELTQVFEAFAQGEHGGGGASHRFGGLGLGLAISRKLVELHSGTIQASSAGRDQGSAFSITLPLPIGKTNEAPASVPESVSPLPESGRSAAIHILLVEDHEPTRIALAHLLTRRHYDVKTAASVAEARELSQKQSFDLLISDIGLPDGSGFELMRELRSRNATLQGIALTGYGMEEDIARSQQAGFASHLIKPIRVQSLEAALAATVQV